VVSTSEAGATWGNKSMNEETTALYYKQLCLYEHGSRDLATSHVISPDPRLYICISRSKALHRDTLRHAGEN